MSKVILRGGPVDGAEIETGDRSVLVTGEEHGMPGMVARYRRTRTREGDRVVFRFREWDRVIARIAT